MAAHTELADVPRRRKLVASVPTALTPPTRAHVVSSSPTTPVHEPTSTPVVWTLSAGTPMPEDFDPCRSYADAWLAAAQGALERAGRRYSPPHAVRSGDEASFEWWAGSNNLTCFVRCHSVELVRSWGHRIDSDMANADPNTADGIVAAWDWLLSGGAQGAGQSR